MHKTLETVITDFDQSVKDCKKYNEARIHRKY